MTFEKARIGRFPTTMPARKTASNPLPPAARKPGTVGPPTLQAALSEFGYGGVTVERMEPSLTERLGGPAARLAQDCIKKVEVVEYAELGMEAIWKIDVKDFPAFIVIDDKGNDFFKELNLS